MSRGDNVQGILGAIGSFWAKLGLRRVRGARVFCVVIQIFRQLHNGRFSLNFVTKRSSVSRRGIREDIFETFHFRDHLPPKSEIENRSNRHLTQSRLQVTGYTAERYCLLHFYSQGQGISEIGQLFSTMYRLHSYGASKLPNFRILAYFPIQNP